MSQAIHQAREGINGCAHKEVRLREFLLPTIATLAAMLAAPGDAPAQPPTPRSVRIAMDTLHQLGGVPPGWMLSPPAGEVARGRKLYRRLGCYTCHAVGGESFPAPTGPGPELTGMGAHHPPGYFAEAVFNPNAVIVDGPGWVGPDGRSTMPSYPDVTLAELADLVAYVQSLTAGDAHHGHGGGHGEGAPPAGEAELPPPPATAATRFLLQTYDVQPGRLAEFEQWFARAGRAEILAQPGVLGIETWVDRSRPGPRLLTVISFADEAAFVAFNASHAGTEIGGRFDSFIGPHGHEVFQQPPLYRVESLSAPPGSPSEPRPSGSGWYRTGTEPTAP